MRPDLSTKVSPSSLSAIRALSITLVKREVLFRGDGLPERVLVDLFTDLAGLLAVAVLFF